MRKETPEDRLNKRLNSRQKPKKDVWIDFMESYIDYYKEKSHESNIKSKWLLLAIVGMIVIIFLTASMGMC